MELTRSFSYVRFPSRVIRDAVEKLTRSAENELPTGKSRKDLSLSFGMLTVARGSERWSYEEFEDFVNLYDQPHDTVFFKYSVWYTEPRVSLQLSMTEYPSNKVEISVSASRATAIHTVMNCFTTAESESRLPEPPATPKPAEPPLKVFIGHGGSSDDWKVVRDELRDKHGYAVEAYEVGARAGHTIRDILGRMLDGSSFAVLCMTGEDLTHDGKMRARQNVVHEAGLFQGRLGFDKVAILREGDVELFSNIDGVQWIGYEPGHVKNVISDLLGALRERFGDRR